MFGNDWDSVLSDVVSEKWFIDMIDSVRKEYNSKTIFPLEQNIFNAFRCTPFSNVKVVILDSQGINYNLYNDVCEVVNKEEDIIVKINLLRREFEYRVKNNTRDKMVVFIDEIYEILKLDNSVKDDINYLLEVGSTMGIYLVVSTDSVLEDDTYDLFNKDNVSKISFYLTSRGEYNMFLGKAIRDNLGKDGMYLDNDKNLIRMSTPMIEDDEIERVCRYIKDNK